MFQVLGRHQASKQQEATANRSINLSQTIKQQVKQTQNVKTMKEEEMPQKLKC